MRLLWIGMPFAALAVLGASIAPCDAGVLLALVVAALVAAVVAHRVG